jgi:CheY-like chemotaxis protein
MYALALNAAGFTTVETADAAYALGRLATRPPAVIVTAYSPGLDGFALCETLNADASTRHIPVIVLSGWIDDRIRALADRAGCVLHVKPFSPYALVTVVAQAIHTSRMGANA